MKTNLFQRTCLPIALILTAGDDAMSCRLVSCTPGQESIMPQDIEKIGVVSIRPHQQLRIDATVERRNSQARTAIEVFISWIMY